MEVDLLDFVEQCRHLAKQALGKHAGEPASGGFVRWIHVVLHCLRLEEDHSYREIPNRLEYMAEIRWFGGEEYVPQYDDDQQTLTATDSERQSNL